VRIKYRRITEAVASEDEFFVWIRSKTANLYVKQDPIPTSTARIRENDRSAK
jgi:hypothetical protein